MVRQTREQLHLDNHLELVKTNALVLNLRCYTNVRVFLGVSLYRARSLLGISYSVGSLYKVVYCFLLILLGVEVLKGHYRCDNVRCH
jgi:hypothetical protein